jgi:hypothetical protein
MLAMKKSCSVLVSLLLCIQIFAQRDMKPGYIITNEDDTVYGQIDFQLESYNAENCFFLKANESNPKVYKPGDIKAYSITDDRFYVSEKVKINDIDKEVFLELLVKGKVNIYFLAPEYYFIENNQNSIHILENTEKIVVHNGQRYIKDGKEYIGVLNTYMQDCPDVWHEITTLRLDQNNLIKLATDYQNKVCPGEKCIIYSKKQPKNIFRIGLAAGCNYNYIKLKMDPFNYTGSNWAPGIMTGMEFNIYTKGISERLSLSTGFYYSVVKQNFLLYRENFIPYKIDYTSKNYLVDFMINYTYPKYRIKPFLGLGILYFKISKNSVVTTYSNHYPKEESTGPLLAGGVNIDISKRISCKFETHFQYGVFNFSGNEDYSSWIRNLNSLISIQYTLNN